MKSLQETFAPNSKCFGCGPSNTQGLQIKSFAQDGNLVAHFTPQIHHQAFENILSGGICGTLLDCHSNWCAAFSIMNLRGENEPPCTVTAKYSVELLRPTPMNKELTIIAKPLIVSPNKAEINAEIMFEDICTAKCNGIFIAVKENHPAYNRW